jgi:hypothetical protein
MGLSNLIALAIIITTAATLHANGTADGETAQPAAEALKPMKVQQLNHDTHDARTVLHWRARVFGKGRARCSVTIKAGRAGSKTRPGSNRIPNGSHSLPARASA